MDKLFKIPIAKSLKTLNLKYSKNRVALIGPIEYIEGISSNSFNLKIWFHNEDLRLEQLKDKDFNELKEFFYCRNIGLGLALYFVLGHTWENNSIKIQNIDREYSDKNEIDIAIHMPFADQIPKALFAHFGMNTKKEVLEDNQRQFYNKLLNSGLLIPFSAIFSQCISFKHNIYNDIVNIIIPCTEIARFHFFSTSKLSKELFSTAFESLYVENEAEPLRLEINGDYKIAYLPAVDGLNDIEINVLAKKFFDPYFGDSVDIIWSDLNSKIIQDRRNEKKYISHHLKTKFPYDDERRLHAYGQHLVIDGLKYFYVLQIYSIDAKSIFNEVVYVPIVDHSSAKNKGNNQKPGGTGTNSDPDDDEDITITDKQGDLTPIVDIAVLIRSKDKYNYKKIPRNTRKPKEIQDSRYKTGKTKNKSQNEFGTSDSYDKDPKVGNANLNSEDDNNNGVNNINKIELVKEALELLPNYYNIVGLNYYYRESKEFLSFYKLNRLRIEDKAKGLIYFVKYLIVQIQVKQSQFIYFFFLRNPIRKNSRCSFVYRTNLREIEIPIIRETIRYFNYYSYIPTNTKYQGHLKYHVKIENIDVSDIRQTRLNLKDKTSLILCDRIIDKLQIIEKGEHEILLE
jgi:hypothetical protein